MRTLHCQLGDHDWQREPQRGQLPKNCPIHKPAKPEPVRPRRVAVRVIAESIQGDGLPGQVLPRNTEKTLDSHLASRARAAELVIAMKALEGRERTVITR